MEPKTFTVKHEKSDGILNIDDTRVWCVVGSETVFAIQRKYMRFYAMVDKNTIVINREDGGVMKTMSIHSKHAGAILGALS